MQLMCLRVNDTIVALVCCCLLWGTTACSSVAEKQPVDTTDTVTEVADYTDDAKQWADSVLSAMTIEERVGQMVMPASYTSADAATMRQICSYVTDCNVGGIIFLKGKTDDMLKISAAIDSLSSLPMFVAMDAETGLSMRLQGAGTLPSARKLGGATEAELYSLGLQLGMEADSLGVNMILGPVLDVAESPASVMYSRSFGSDAKSVARSGCAFARGIRDAGVVAVGKHFPGHGATTTDSHRSLPLVGASAQRMEQVDLLPFRSFISEGNTAIMVGHLAVPSLGGDSVPASLSPKIITDLLRNKYRFSGLVLTDALNMKGAATSGDQAVEAVKAGADLIMAPENTRHTIDAILKAVESGEISEDRIDDSVRRILFVKYTLDL